MHRAIRLPLLLVVSLFVFQEFSHAAPGAGRGAAKKPNPHTDIACDQCHANKPVKGETPWSEILSGFRKPPLELCRECHPELEVRHHPVEKPVHRNLPEGLPLSAKGRIICSTCHNFHLDDAGNDLLRGFDTGRYAVRMDMCLDCHGENFSVLNPHLAGAEGEKCYTCHTTKPGATDTAATATRQENLNRICDFCHNVSNKAHPSNVDTMKKIPAELPRGTGGEVFCGTCHDPHGTADTLHFLRKKYVETIEAGRYVNPHVVNEYHGCIACHAEVSPQKEVMRKNRRYGGDDLQICLSCHGTMDADHPVLVKIGKNMKPGKELPLTADGKITCLTCHDPSPCAGKGITMRGKKGGGKSTSICFQCHDRKDLSERNPHLSMSDRSACKFCHDTMTDPTNEEAARVSFISNTRLICLRCHEQDNHPSNADHMVTPRMAIPKVFKLDERGKITCTSCHNPHINVYEGGDDKGRQRRFVTDGDSRDMCGACHRR